MEDHENTYNLVEIGRGVGGRLRRSSTASRGPRPSSMRAAVHVRRHGCDAVLYALRPAYSKGSLGRDGALS